MHFCSKFGNCNFNWWWVIPWRSSKWGKFWLWSSIWPWRSRSILPQNNRDLNQGLLHLWSKSGDPSLNGWWVIARTSSWLMHGRTHTQTDAGNDNTRRPKLAWGNNGKILKETFTGCVQLIHCSLGGCGFDLKCYLQIHCDPWAFPAILPLSAGPFLCRHPANET